MYQNNSSKTEKEDFPKFFARLDNKFLVFILTTIFLFPFLFLSIKKSTASMPDADSILIPFINLEGNFILFILGKFVFICLPIIFITMVELISSKSKNGYSFNKTSIGRMRNSEGHKLADLWYFVFGLIKSQFPFVITTITLGGVLSTKFIESSFDEIYSSFLPLPTSNLSSCLVLIFALLIGDFSRYIQHRLAHSFPLIWDQHEFHHSATEMTILSARRNSPLEKVFTEPLTAIFYVLAAFLIKYYISKGYYFALTIFTFHSTMAMLGTYLGHSSLKVIYPKPLSYIYMSPSLHWLHHSSNKKHWDRNFGERFTFWDKLFGTYLDESNIKDISSFGVPGTKYNKYNPIYASTILPINKLLSRLSFGR